MNIKDMILNKETGEKRVVRMTRYRKENLYYVTECGFEFPVPISEVGDATFNAEEKAPLLMRYIRKHISTIEKQNG